MAGIALSAVWAVAILVCYMLAYIERQRLKLQVDLKGGWAPQELRTRLQWWSRAVRVMWIVCLGSIVVLVWHLTDYIDSQYTWLARWDWALMFGGAGLVGLLAGIVEPIIDETFEHKLKRLSDTTEQAQAGKDEAEETPDEAD